MFSKKSQSGATGTSQNPTDMENRPLSAANTAKPSPSTPPPPQKSPFPLGTSAAAKPSTESGSRLHVGRDIHLKGEITACDRLIVEGRVEASMNSREIDISESGVFEGEVTVDVADISGRFEGALTVRKRLIVRKTGQINGDIQYGEIEIEPGGQIGGKFNRTKEADQTDDSKNSSLAPPASTASEASQAHH